MFLDSNAFIVCPTAAGESGSIDLGKERLPHGKTNLQKSSAGEDVIP